MDTSTTYTTPAKFPTTEEEELEHFSKAVKKRLTRYPFDHLGLTIFGWSAVGVIVLILVVAISWAVHHCIKVVRRRRMAAFGYYNRASIDEPSIPDSLGRSDKKKRRSKKLEGAKKAAEGKKSPAKIVQVDERKPVKMEKSDVGKKLIKTGRPEGIKLEKSDVKKRDLMQKSREKKPIKTDEKKPTKMRKSDDKKPARRTGKSDEKNHVKEDLRSRAIEPKFASRDFSVVKSWEVQSRPDRKKSPSPAKRRNK